MPLTPTAHVAQDVANQIGVPTWLVVVTVCAGALLSLRHLAVKHGSLHGPVVWRWLAVMVAVAVATMFAVPSTIAAQSPQATAGLPDLISDAPFLWFDKTAVNEDGSLARVLAFDGYLHNVGEGSLDLFGNPQIEGDMKQRVFDGESWEEVSSPTVRYETTDGHNHFHLIGAVDYTLWSESQARQVGISSKVGFCLVDTEQIEETHDQFYDLDRFDYCKVDDPNATELRMGITPGWRDTYDASITLQWVDVSDVQPGRYWVGAVTDPLDEIVESDEDNNSLVYSMNTLAVAGYLPADLGPVAVEGETIVGLPSVRISTVGLPSWVITDGPEHGSIDVPTGVSLNVGQVVYRPDPGFEGTDSISYQVRDSSRIFPFNPKIEIIDLVVAAPPDGDDDDDGDGDGGPQGENRPPVFDDTDDTDETNGTDLSFDLAEFVSVEAAFGASDPDGDTVRWFASNLPGGLRLDEETGVVSGLPTARGVYDSQIVAWDGTEGSAIDVVWNVSESPDELSLWPRNQLDSAVGDRVWVTVGNRPPGAIYEFDGLPAGLAVVDNKPRFSGSPKAPGRYEVVVYEVIDDVVTSTVEFVWTVRPNAVPAFPL